MRIYYVIEMEKGMAYNRFFVMLGASNLTIALNTALKLATGFIMEPKAIYVAHGPGRSYLRRAGLPLLRFDGIALCPLLDELETAVQDIPDPMIYALLTDIGNDLVYNKSPEQIAVCIEGLVKRLCHMGAEIGITPIPETTLLTLSPTKYHLLRTFYNPLCRVSYREMMRNVKKLSDLIAGLCTQYGVRLLHQNPDWYGFDCIHLSRRFRETAFYHWFREIVKDAAPREKDRDILSFSLLGKHLSAYRRLFLGGHSPQCGWQITKEARLYIY